ncbi:MAG: hypothetical protein Q7S13_06780 [Candidatus Omnitrophota bacterium]|nr:hypothetical protein [Candidatus Omnitrophota bacterium]
MADEKKEDNRDFGKKCAFSGVTIRKRKRYYRDGLYYKNKTAYLGHREKLTEEKKQKDEEAQKQAADKAAQQAAQQQTEPKAQQETPASPEQTQG